MRGILCGPLAESCRVVCRQVRRSNTALLGGPGVRPQQRGVQRHRALQQVAVVLTVRALRSGATCTRHRRGRPMVRHVRRRGTPCIAGNGDGDAAVYNPRSIRTLSVLRPSRDRSPSPHTRHALRAAATARRIWRRSCTRDEHLC
jgi:hypothetical protein